MWKACFTSFDRWIRQHLDFRESNKQIDVNYSVLCLVLQPVVWTVIFMTFNLPYFTSLLIMSLPGLIEVVTHEFGDFGLIAMFRIV